LRNNIWEKVREIFQTTGTKKWKLKLQKSGRLLMSFPDKLSFEFFEN
jgi:hypothetical protein